MSSFAGLAPSGPAFKRISTGKEQQLIIENFLKKGHAARFDANFEDGLTALQCAQSVHDALQSALDNKCIREGAPAAPSGCTYAQMKRHARNWAEAQMNTPGDWANLLAANVFGVSIPSDTDGDWTESDSLGRIPIRFVREGESFAYRTGSGVWFGWQKMPCGFLFFCGHEKASGPNRRSQ
ncbi:hypothetical protein QQ054_15045 [Oscillatoria amoena NRMC-F 0135]|nr:hypothetical protein [Oscillatoria amoena NRMC-F 0135]